MLWSGSQLVSALMQLQAQRGDVQSIEKSMTVPPVGKHARRQPVILHVPLFVTDATAWPPENTCGHIATAESCITC